ncbi:unnamed protein product [Amoebophrya sp. A25]|nr:unnamed protein product [Amoebophrya sp. A25]|eukprot:GSA25T00010668001.1
MAEERLVFPLEVDSDSDNGSCPAYNTSTSVTANTPGTGEPGGAAASRVQPESSIAGAAALPSQGLLKRNEFLETNKESKNLEKLYKNASGLQHHDAVCVGRNDGFDRHHRLGGEFGYLTSSFSTPGSKTTTRVSGDSNMKSRSGTGASFDEDSPNFESEDDDSDVSSSDEEDEEEDEFSNAGPSSSRGIGMVGGVRNFFGNFGSYLFEGAHSMDHNKRKGPGGTRSYKYGSGQAMVGPVVGAAPPELYIEEKEEEVLSPRGNKISTRDSDVVPSKPSANVDPRPPETPSSWKDMCKCCKCCV